MPLSRPLGVKIHFQVKCAVCLDQLDGWIKVRLEVNETRLVYTIANSKIKTLSYPADGEGIGLKNVKRRLDLSYPGKHKLDIDDREDSYSVILTIEQP